MYDDSAHEGSPLHGVDPVLRARHVTKAFGKTLALDGVDLDVLPGDRLAIMGPSGSGKSTLLHCLSGVLRPDTGSVLLARAVGAVDLAALDAEARAKVRREEFGFVFQQGFLIPELTATENVALPLMLSGMGRQAAEIAARDELARVGLDGMEARRMGELSGGQVQRVAIARATVGDARVIFADEPTGSLDSVTGGVVLDLLADVSAASGAALVVVTHDQAVAARCSRVVHLRDGHVVSSTDVAP